MLEPRSTRRASRWPNICASGSAQAKGSHRRPWNGIANSPIDKLERFPNRLIRKEKLWSGKGSVTMVTQHVVGGRYAGTIFGGFAGARGGCCGWRVFGAVGGRTIWGFCQHGDSLGAAFSRRRSCRAAGDGGRPPLTLAGAPGSDRRAVGPATGSDLTGDPRRPGRAWDQCWAGEFVALSQGAEHHAKKRVFTPPSKIAST